MSHHTCCVGVDIAEGHSQPINLIFDNETTIKTEQHFLPQKKKKY